MTVMHLLSEYEYTVHPLLSRDTVSIIMKIIVIAFSCCLLVASAESQSCGQTPISPQESRIVGGQKAIPYSWPWEVAFCQHGFWSCRLFCGASLISNQWIMTAGHCVYGSTNNPSKFRVKLGVYDEENDNEKGEIVAQIDKTILHPQYNHKTTSHDIALLHLKTAVSFTDHIQPACVPKSDANALTPNTMVTVTGWGDTSEGGNISPQLRQVDVPVVSYTECNQDYNGEIEQDVMFCAGVKGKDSCQGDSGGPVVKKSSDGSRYIQYGIVSWGYGCAEAGYPGVYSRVSAYADWITQQTGVQPV